MTLGSILAQLNDGAILQEALADLDDVVLLARLGTAAEAAHEPVGSFASALVGHFVQHANDEQWLALLSAANRADNPAGAALRRILLMGLPEQSRK